MVQSGADFITHARISLINNMETAIKELIGRLEDLGAKLRNLSKKIEEDEKELAGIIKKIERIK